MRKKIIGISGIIDTADGVVTINPQNRDVQIGSAASVVNIVSDSANDDSAGTGARTVKVEGVDAGWNRKSETVTMNGTTPVSTSTEFLAVTDLEVQTVGSGGVAAGNITATHDTDATEHLRIVAGENGSLAAWHIVAQGELAIIERMTAGFDPQGGASPTGGSDAEVGLYIKRRADLADSPYILKQLETIIVNGSSVTSNETERTRVGDRSIIALRVRNVNTNGTTVYGEFLIET